MEIVVVKKEDEIANKKEELKKWKKTSFYDKTDFDDNNKSFLDKIGKKQQKQPKTKKIRNYTEKDVLGLTVAHSLDDFDNEQILILKDTTIEQAEEFGDALESFELTEIEKTNKNLLNKTKKLIYDPYKLDLNNEKMGLLYQYDEEYEPVQKSFKLEKDLKITKPEEKTEKTGLTLDYQKFIQINDYQLEQDVKIKKSKRKPKGSRVKELEYNDKTYTKLEHSNLKSNVTNVNFIDDDDLQNALSRTRNIENKRKDLKLNGYFIL